MSLIKILIWKDRFNARQTITVSRFIISYNESSYYQLIARHSSGDHLLINIKVTNLHNITSTEQAIKYGKTHLKGHESKIMEDVQRSTKENIRLRRIQLDIENAILTFISQYGSGPTISQHCYNKEELTSIRLPMEHDSIDRYGDTQSQDTDSNLNFSDCSGDTRAEGMATCELEILELLDIETAFDDLNKDHSDFCDQISDCLSDYNHEIYSDCVAFHKAVSSTRINMIDHQAVQSNSLKEMKESPSISQWSPKRKEYLVKGNKKKEICPQLISRRKQYWLNSPLYKELAGLILNELVLFNGEAD